MPNILHIETSTNVCSVALSRDGVILFEKKSFEGPSHAALLGVFAEETVNYLKQKGERPDAVAVSSGPGSYTGLRIGVSLAKGLCFGYDIPLIAVPTLDILAYQAIRKNQRNPDYLYCAMLDACRMEVYSALYDSNLAPLRETQVEIIDENSYRTLLETQKICFFGNGAAKCKNSIQRENALFLEDIHPLATEMVTLAEAAWEKKEFADTAYFDPYYLKDFVATVAKNKVLGNQ
ncbi:MAG: tRNA (adenosine(37)-N6)-threonylcarbamoyltransferase complex dimerization subunit type 1 TsaB [Tannerellaceae bacterium]|nr:tRNA (adenosine(37)-N6)-threonylcarbamoyltransferase complex dimerization subunit type 1 TsaB [Tannerellaceae bacterium]